jgi:hypothetical protein
MTFEKERKKIEHKISFDFLYNFGLKYFFILKSERDMIKNIYWSSCKVHFILVRV